MAVRIRLKRTGTKNAPSFRIVVMESRQPRDGKVIDTLGRYNPRTNPIDLWVDKTKAQKWLSQGAIPSAVLARLLFHAGLMEKPKPTKRTLLKKTKAKKA